MEQQLCLNHGIHLGVTKALTKPKIPNTSKRILLPEEEDSEDEQEELESGFTFELVDLEEHELRNEICELLRKMRKIIKHIKRSKQEDLLRELTKNDQSVILDFTVRWSSTLKMLRRFVKIQDALVELDNSYALTFEELELAKSLISALTPAEVAIDELSKSSSTLITAKVTIDWLLEKTPVDNAVGLMISEFIKNNVLKRETKLSQIVNYLHCNTYETSDEVKVEMTGILADLYDTFEPNATKWGEVDLGPLQNVPVTEEAVVKRPRGRPRKNPIPVPSSQQAVPQPTVPQPTILTTFIETVVEGSSGDYRNACQKSLSQALEAKMKAKHTSQSISTYRLIRQELDTFKVSGNRG